MDRILRRLVRNNGVVIHRYAPDGERDWLLEQTLVRYRSIAEKERATQGYEVGARELTEALDRERRTPMDEARWRRFTGEAAARSGADRLAASPTVGPVWVGARGKHDWAIERALRAAGIETVDRADRAGTIVVGTLSPGPAIDATRRLRSEHPGKPVVCLWSPAESEAGDGPGAGTAAAGARAGSRGVGSPR